MNYIEIIAFISTLVCVIGLANRKVYGWYASIIGVLAYFILFYQEKLYMDMILQVFFLIQSVIGIVKWKQEDIEEIKSITWDRFFFHFSTTAAVGFILGLFLSEYTDANQPYLDSILTLMCLLANHYLIKKIVQSWFLWILIDIFYLLLFYNQGMHLSIGLYVLLLLNSIRGLYMWRKEL